MRDPDTFLYNTGPIASLGSPNWNRVQTYDVGVVKGGSFSNLGSGLPCPPCNWGRCPRRATPAWPRPR